MASEALRRLFEELSNEAATRRSATAPGPTSPPAATRHTASAAAPSAAEAPQVVASPKPQQRLTKPRLTRPGVCAGDPEAPIVDPQATRVLCILELAGTVPRLTPEGRLELAHPERVSDDMRAAATLHQADIEAILEYRALLEQLWPVEAEPLPLPSRQAEPP